MEEDLRQQPSSADELDAYLDALARDGAYETVRPLGSAPASGVASTELVLFRGPDGTSLGPFVRKRIPLETGLGAAYGELFELQRSGVRFVHLPRVIDLYKTGDVLVVVLEYIPGETLEARVGSIAPGLSARERFEALEPVLFELCDAVEELHRAADPPIVHRDIKPANIIVAPAGLFLIDLGIARRVRDGASCDTARFGTRAYAPPEQYGFGQTDGRSDVYALGMVLLFCLAGREPTGRAGSETLAALGVPELATIIARATALDPDDRFGSARELAHALKQAARRMRDEAPAEEGWSVGPDKVSTGPTGSPAGSSRSARADSAGTASSVDADRSAMGERTESGHAAADPQNIRTGRLNLLGVTRNALVLVFCIALVPNAIEFFMRPAEENVGKPLWYLVWMSLGICLPFCWGLLYLAMDREILARFVPAISGRTRLQDARVLGLFILASFTLLLAASIAFGV